MKKITLLCILLFAITWNMESQNSVFADALYLRKSVIESQKKIILKDNVKLLLLGYYKPATDITVANLNSNLYFNDLFLENGAAQAPDPYASKLLSNPGSMDVTAIADGFARFIVKRTKEELSIAFFEKFKTALDDNPDIRSLFPKTYQSLQAIDSEIYTFKAYIQTLREAFESDLSALPDNLPQIIDNHKVFFNSKPDLKATLLSGFYIAKAIKDGTHPGEIIEFFPINAWDDASINKNYIAAFETMQLISTSFRDANSIGNYWVESTELRKLSSDEILLKLYLGLLSEKAKQNNGITFITSGGTTTLSAVLQANSANLQPYRNFLSGLIVKTKAIELEVADVKTTTDSLRYEKYYRLVTGGISVMEYVASNQELLGLKKNDVNLKELTAPYFTTTKSVADLAIDVNRLKYASVIVALVNIIDKNLAGETIDLPDTKLLFKYGSFMAAVANAKNSKEVEDAIEAFALPAGSARIKRETDFSVSINSYCGLFYGGENIKGLDKGYKGTFGVTAPVGIAISAGKTKFLSKKAHASHSLFLSLVDLGAVTAFRFKDDTTESVPKIELKDIISPGIFYSLGIAGTPLSMNFGYQIGPLLRTVKETENSYSSSYSRISVSIVVDIPILNLYTKTK